MKKLIVFGARNAIQNTHSTENRGDNLLENNPYQESVEYEITLSRSDAQRHVLDVQEGDAIELEFEDGHKWIVPAQHVEEIFSSLEMRSSPIDGEFVIPNVISTQTDYRGRGNIILKFVRTFFKSTIKNLSQKEKRELGEAFDNANISKEGVFNFIDEHKQSKLQLFPGKRHLLFIHGFASNVSAGFEGIKCHSKILWETLKIEYESRILGFDHHTLSKSPILNTMDLLKEIPDGVELDVVVHSRGGLVADLLARCAELKGNAFVDEDIKLVSAKEEKLLKELNQLAGTKSFKINKIIRVASPMRGTVLASQRLDQFLSCILYGLEFVSGGVISPAISTLRKFSLEIIASRTDSYVFPGISAMVPNSGFQSMLNLNRVKLNSDLFVVEGVSKIGWSLKQFFGTIVSNIFFRMQNDFVVNSNSMRYGTLRLNDIQVVTFKDRVTNHFGYFKNDDVAEFLSRVLIFDGNHNVGTKRYEVVSLTTEEVINQKALILSNPKKSFIRGGDEGVVVIAEDEFDISLEESKVQDLVDVLYGPELEEDSQEEISEMITVTLTHGDLKFADFPVLVGHFKDEKILHAEDDLDTYLDGRLKELYFLGNYLKGTDDSIVVVKANNRPSGGLVVGLGEWIEFNEYQLRTGVENGIISYANYMRNHVDNIELAQSISCLCIGTGFGGLDMEYSLSAILFGIKKANEKIRDLNKFISQNNDQNEEGPKFFQTIRNVQFIELYEDKARTAYYSLRRIKELNYKLNLKLPSSINTVHGAKKRTPQSQKSSWWHEMVTETISSASGSQNAGLRFLSSGGRAKLDLRTDYYAKSVVERLLSEISRHRSFDQGLSNSLFQLLIPNDLKGVLRNQSNIIWKMDRQTAQIPWELIHDKDYDKVPTFVNTGIVRQLISEQQFTNEKITRESNALIIANPIYTNFSDLPAAEDEGELLHNKLSHLGWDSKFIPRRSLLENITALLNRKYKILHIAGHGVYNAEKGEAGIVMEDTLIDSAFLSKLPHIPELAFINCCYTGTIENSLEELYHGRYKLSASIGVQLIEMGVNAVVITGWAVNDNAAYDFADKFYQLMLGGEQFGNAVQIARKYIYDINKASKKYGSDDKTWGAYQCYGDPWYILSRHGRSSTMDKDYLNEEEVLIDLHNIKSKIINKDDKVKSLFELDFILNAIQKDHLDNANVLEKIAEIYVELDELGLAVDVYEMMIQKSVATYSMKAYEQYIAVKVKHTYEQPNFKEKVKKLEEKFKDLLCIAPTHERFCLLGEFYKTIAFLKQDEKPAHMYIKKMNEQYWKAYEQLKDGNIRDYIYPLCIALQTQYILSPSNIYTKAKGQREKVLDVLKSEIEDLSGISKLHDKFWKDIAMVNLNTTKLLFFSASNNSLELEQVKKTIIKEYLTEFIDSGSQKNIRSEIEHFRFLKKFVDQEDKKKYLGSIHEELSNLYQKIN